MCRKWRTTGRNRLIAALLALALACGTALFASAEPALTLEVSGFALDFKPEQDYYLASPADFSKCSINGFSGASSLTVQVAHYNDAKPYSSTAYQLGKPLNLGHGRAKITLTFTMADQSTKEYLIALTDPNAAGYAYCRTTQSRVVLRESKSESAQAAFTVTEKGTRMYYLGTEGEWSRVQRLYNTAVYYVKADQVRVNWQEVAMPSRFRSAVAALQQAHPNWSFSFVDVERSFEDAVAKYGEKARDYLDPLDYLTESKVYALLDINRYTADYTAEGVGAMWLNENAFSKAQAADYMLTASRSLLMNAYYITCRAALESGYGTSTLARGTVAGYEGWYNFYGIGAIDSNPLNGGASYAKGRGWNSVFRSIVEGANWIKDQYLDTGSITPYFFRFSSINSKSYMTDMKAPTSEASILARVYKNDKTSALHFVVPVYSEWKADTDLAFTDLDPGAWYYEEVAGAAKAGIFNGVAPDRFDPSGVITRAEFVTALSRLCGEDVTGYRRHPFTDVESGKWYVPYISWAYQNGVVDGTSPTTFDPDQPVNREQMSKMMASALEKVLGVTLTTTGAEPFNDQSSISDWAVSWVEKCNAAGLFRGDEHKNFNPQVCSSRSEAACVFYRAYQKYVAN